LAILSLGYNTLGKAIMGAIAGARGMVGLQSALAAMSGIQYGGLAKAVDALKGMALAIPGLATAGEILAGVGAALATVSAPVWGGIAAGVALVAAAGYAL